EVLRCHPQVDIDVDVVTKKMRLVSSSRPTRLRAAGSDLLPIFENSATTSFEESALQQLSGSSASSSSSSIHTSVASSKSKRR
ncbi:unnamed protein product, partial [Amoebophrya sp. A120]